MLDGGGALFRDLAVADGAPGDAARRRAELVARVFHRVGVGAVNLGRRDLAAGLAFVGALGRDPGLPWVATNLRTTDGDAPFARWRVLEWGDARVGVVGVLAPDPTHDPTLGIQVEDPAAAVKEAVEAMGPVDAVLCLADLGLDAERELARRVPLLRLIVGGGAGELLATPAVEGRTLILHAADRGRYLGVLDLPAKALADGRSPVNRRERELLERRVASLAATLRDYPADQAPEARRRLDLVAGQLREARAALNRFDAEAVTYDHRLLPLDAAVGEDPEVAGWVAGYHKEEAQGRTAAATQRAAPVRPPPQPAPGAFDTGTAACRSCHAQAYQAWVATPHARAYAVLGNRPRDPQCLRCHASQLTRTTGPAVEPVVGCESCHGPGGNHRGRGNVARRPPESTCRACHAGFHPGQTFEYVTALAKIRCDRRGMR